MPPRLRGLISINYKLIYGLDGNEVFFRIERSKQLKKLISAYCDRKSVEINSIAFLFDGGHLRGQHTPDEIIREGNHVHGMVFIVSWSGKANPLVKSWDGCNKHLGTRELLWGQTSLMFHVYPYLDVKGSLLQGSRWCMVVEMRLKEDMEMHLDNMLVVIDIQRDDYCRLLSYVLLPLYLQVIEDMEKLLARELHRNIVVSERRIREHATSQRYRKIQEISDGGGVARSLLHKKVRQRRASPVLVSKADDSRLQSKMASFSSQSTPKESDTAMVILRSNSTHPNINKDLFSNENILGSKDPNRSFPNGESSDGLGLLKWRIQSKDASALPLTSKFLYVSVSMLDDGLILLEVARWADRSGCITVKNGFLDEVEHIVVCLSRYGLG
ncbi:DNA mismatch repair protein MutS [Tanacetum coccineum]